MQKKDKKTIKKKDGSKYIELDPRLESLRFFQKEDGSWTPDMNENSEGLTLEELEDVGLDEMIDLESLDERAVLSIQQRRARGRNARRMKTRLKIGRKRAERRKASKEKLDVRARKKAREIIRKRLSAGKDYKDMSPSEKIQLDTRLNRIPDSVIKRLATRQMPIVRRAEMERLASVLSRKKNESLDEKFEAFLESYTPPKRHHTLYNKEGAVKYDRRFKMFKRKSKMDEDFLDESFELMEEVESIQELEKSKGDPCWKDYVQLGTKKKGNRKVPNCVPKNESVDKTDPKNREHGTDSLVRILKKDTPGQQLEAYFDRKLGNDFGGFERGSKVMFNKHSMDDVTGDNMIQGTVVGSTVGYLRVRDSEGTLYKVRHKDAAKVSE